MQVEPNWELNISQNGQHFCRVELGNTTLSEARTVAEVFYNKFHEIDGFKVTVRRIECSAQEVHIL